MHGDEPDTAGRGRVEREGQRGLADRESVDPDDHRASVVPAPARSPRTITTGQAPRAASATATDPSSRPGQPAQPAVAQHQQLRPPGLRPQHLDRRADRHLGRRLDVGPDVRGDPRGPRHLARAIFSSSSRYCATRPASLVGRSDVVQENARTRRSSTPRRAASAAAHSTAR